MSPQDKCTLSFYRDLEPMGASDKVVLVRHIETGQVFVKKRLSAYSREMYRFLKGRDIAGVPHIYECLDDDDYIVVIEEYVPGLTLRRYMDTEGPLPEKRAIQLIEKICTILDRLHNAEQPIVCRDLKPANVVLTADDSVVIVDFDAAKFVREEKVDTVLLGTPGYAAPEQFGFAASDERTDVYAVGVLLNEMLTGYLPQDQKAGGRLGRVVERSTSLDPKERHRTVSDFRKDLNGKLYEVSRYTDDRRRFLPPGFRSRVWWKMVVAILTYSFGIFIGIMFFIGGNASAEGNSVFENVALGVFWTLLFCWTIAYLFNYLDLRSKMPVNRLEIPWMRALAHVVLWVIGCVVCLFVAVIIMAIGEIGG